MIGSSQVTSSALHAAAANDAKQRKGIRMQMLFIINRVWLNEPDRDPFDSPGPTAESLSGSNRAHSFRSTAILVLLSIPTFLHINSIASDGGKEDEWIFVCEPSDGYVVDASCRLTE